MNITPDLSVKALVEQLESRALADLQFAADLRQKAGMLPREGKKSGMSNVVQNAVKIINDAVNKEKATLADNIYDVLASEGVGLSAPAIRDRLLSAGIGLDNKNLLPAIYTAMSRKEKVFVKSANGVWDLKERQDAILNGVQTVLQGNSVLKFG